MKQFASQEHSFQEYNIVTVDYNNNAGLGTNYYMLLNISSL